MVFPARRSKQPGLVSGSIQADSHTITTQVTLDIIWCSLQATLLANTLNGLLPMFDLAGIRR
jgi:hypothetical protein